MGIIIKDRNPLISYILTDYGKQNLSLGQLSFDYYAFGDSDIDYRTADINSSILKPVPGLTDLKYLLYKKDQNCFYQMSSDNIESTEIIENQRHVFNVFYDEDHIINIDKRFIGIEGEIIGMENQYILNVEFDNPIKQDDIKPLDFITLYLSNEFKYVENTAFDIFHCQIENVILTDKTAKIYLKQPLNPNLKLYRFFITSSNFLFFDNQSWNQIFCGGESLPNQEKRFDGIRHYFDASDGLLIYHHNEINQNDFIETSTNVANLNIPTIMWDKSPINKMGLKLHTENSMEDIVSPINQYARTNRIELKDEYNNRVGCYLPQHKMFYIDDVELSTTMAGKNGRNWTLPSIDFEYIPSNGNGVFNKTNDDLYVTYVLKGGVYDNTSYCRKLLYIPNRKGDYQLNLDFSNFNLPSTFDQSRRIKEVSILFQYVSPGNPVNPNGWKEITMLKGDNLMIDNIRAKYGLNIQHINRGISYQYDKPTNLDEQLFLGNVNYITQTKKYKTTFNFVTDPNRTIYTSNPTYSNDKEIRVSEVGVYDKKYKLVAYAKVSHSIRWRKDVAFTIKTQMIF
jgi:hypothetical protein